MKNFRKSPYERLIKTIISELGWGQCHEVMVTERISDSTMCVTYPRPKGVINHDKTLQERLEKEIRGKKWRFGWY